MWVAIKQKCQPILISENNCYTYHTNSQFILTSCTHSLRSFLGNDDSEKEGDEEFAALHIC